MYFPCRNAFKRGENLGRYHGSQDSLFVLSAQDLSGLRVHQMRLCPQDSDLSRRIRAPHILLELVTEVLVQHCLNAIGLVLGMLGVVVIFFWGPPQPSFGTWYAPSPRYRLYGRYDLQKEKRRTNS